MHVIVTREATCHSAKPNHPKSLQDMHYTSHYRSPLGNITLASDGEALTGLWFDGQRYFAAGLDPKHSEYKLPVFDDTRRWLDNYFSGKTPDFTPPLHLIGSPFRQHVWTELLRIPHGRVTTYRHLAKLIGIASTGGPMSARAVGGAVGHNPVSLIVPCHRVVGTDESLTGYAGGMDKKRFLLGLEGIDCHRLTDFLLE